MIHLDGYHLSPGLSPADSAALVAALDVDTWPRLDEGDPCRPTRAQPEPTDEP